jgi:hypothetical protein
MKFNILNRKFNGYCAIKNEKFIFDYFSVNHDFVVGVPFIAVTDVCWQLRIKNKWKFYEFNK